MGTDKAFVEIDGVPMVERVAAALTAGGCRSVQLVGGDAALLARFGHPVVVDRFPGEGPAGGVLTALGAAGAADVVVIAACDLPWLDAATVSAVASVLDGPAVHAAVAVTDRWQQSLTAWRPAAAGVLATAWADGRRSMHDLLRAVRYIEVAVAADAIRNVNTPGDLGVGRASPRASERRGAGAGDGAR